MGLGMVAGALAEVPLGVLLGRREMAAKAKELGIDAIILTST